MCWLCVVGGSNEGARPGVSVFREAVGSLGWTESGSRAWRRANPKSRTVKKVPTFPESTSSRLRKVRLSARADAGGPAVARTGRIVAEAGHGGKEKSAPPAAPRRAFLRFPKRRRRRDPATPASAEISRLCRSVDAIDAIDKVDQVGLAPRAFGESGDARFRRLRRGVDCVDAWPFPGKPPRAAAGRRHRRCRRHRRPAHGSPKAGRARSEAERQRPAVRAAEPSRTSRTCEP